MSKLVVFAGSIFFRYIVLLTDIGDTLFNLEVVGIAAFALHNSFPMKITRDLACGTSLNPNNLIWEKPSSSRKLDQILISNMLFLRINPFLSESDLGIHVCRDVFTGEVATIDLIEGKFKIILVNTLLAVIIQFAQIILIFDLSIPPTMLQLVTM